MPPSFPSTRAYLACLDNLEYWWPHAIRVFERHGFDVDTNNGESGRGGTFPTLICDDVVVQLFGHLPFWGRAYAAECAAMRCTARDPDILAPKLLSQGQLFDDPTTPCHT